MIVKNAQDAVKDYQKLHDQENEKSRINLLLTENNVIDVGSYPCTSVNWTSITLTAITPTMIPPICRFYVRIAID